MRMIKPLLAGILLAGAAFATPSHAVTITALSSGVLTPGGPVETFDSQSTGPNGSFFSATLNATVTGGSFDNGSTTGIAASPYFGNPGRDTTEYATVGPSAGQPMTFSFNAPQSQFGFYIGSLDSYNSLVFSLNSVVVATVTGTDIGNATGLTPNGGQDTFAAARYLIFSNLLFDTVQEFSSQNALESDNYSGAAATPIPAALPLFASGLGALGLLGRLRKRRRKVTA